MTKSYIMSASMNMAITIFGFALSALFIMVICCRLLCLRARRSTSQLNMFPAANHSIARSFTVERSHQGMEHSVVASFPIIRYNEQIFTSAEDNLCTICLGDYKENEALRVLPRCGHTFHLSCIDVWLGQHYTCPVCRISLREWRHHPRPLIGTLAKPRFLPGALPDHLFEQPKSSDSLSRKCSGWSAIRDRNQDFESGEPSSLSLPADWLGDTHGS